MLFAARDGGSGGLTRGEPHPMRTGAERRDAARSPAREQLRGPIGTW